MSFYKDLAFDNTFEFAEGGKKKSGSSSSARKKRRDAAAAKRKKERESKEWDKTHAYETNSEKSDNSYSGGIDSSGNASFSVGIPGENRQQQCGGCHNGKEKPTGINAWDGSSLTPAPADYVPKNKR